MFCVVFASNGSVPFMLYVLLVGAAFATILD